MKHRFLTALIILALATVSCSVFAVDIGGTPAAPTGDTQSQTQAVLVETLSALGTEVAQNLTTPPPGDTPAAANDTPVPEPTAAPLPALVLLNENAPVPLAMLLDPLSGETRGAYELPQYARSSMARPVGDSGIVYLGDSSTAVYDYPFREQARKLEFMNPDGGFFEGIFLPSPDGTSIAWGVVDSMDASGTAVRLLVSNLDGSDLRTYVSKQTESPSRPTPLAWSNDNTVLYYSNMLYGIGGYILFGGYPDLVRLDLVSGTETVILSREQTGSGLTPLALSPDRSKLAYLKGGDPHTLVVRDLATGLERSVSLNARYKTGGAIVWKPDGSELVFNLALMNPDAEAYTTLRLDINSMAVSELLPEDARQLRTVAWTPAGVVWLNDADSNAWRLDLASSELKQVSSGARVLPPEW